MIISEICLSNYYLLLSLLFIYSLLYLSGLQSWHYTPRRPASIKQWSIACQLSPQRSTRSFSKIPLMQMVILPRWWLHRDTLFRLRKSVRRSEAWLMDIFYSSFGVFPAEVYLCACCQGCNDNIVGKDGKMVHVMSDTFMWFVKERFVLIFDTYHVKNRFVFLTQKEKDLPFMLSEEVLPHIQFPSYLFHNSYTFVV